MLLSGGLAIATGIAPPQAGWAYAHAPAAIDFDIPAQPLATALIAFGKQANVQVLTSGGAIARFRSNGVQGSYPVAEALRLLLQGTNLDYRFTGEGTVAVTPREAAPAGAASPAGHAQVKELTPVEANALVGRDVGFMATLNSEALRNDADLIDVPQSVSVVTRDLMDSQQMLSVADALRNVAGVASVDGADGLPLFQVRGFYTGNGLTDGMPNSIAGSGDYPPLIGLQRVEVLKGPQSILGDATGSSFGGQVNVTLKQPQSEPLHELSYAIGEQGYTQLGMDLAGPLGHAPGWSYRLVLSGEYAARTPQGYRDRRSAYVAPSIGWHGDTTQLVVGVQRILNRLPVPDHVLVLDDGVSPGLTTSPAGILPGNPYDYASYQTNRLYLMLDQQLGDTWSWRSRGQYVRQSNDQKSWSLLDPTPVGDTNAWAEAYRYGDAYYSLQNDLVGVFETGARTTHTVTLGFDYSRSRVSRSDDYWHAYDGVYNLFTSPALPRVQAVVRPADDESIAGTPWSVDNGLFLQDQLALGERWNALLSLRRAAYEVSTDDVQGEPWRPHRTKWVPNAGLLYKLTPDISLYGGVANGFQPVSYLGQDGRPLVPALSRQLETGAKFNLFDGRARLTVSLYRIMLDHSYLLVDDAPPHFATLGPGQTNRGLEVEFTGQVAPGLDLSTSYTNAMIRNHDGTAPTGAPRQRYSVWASHAFQGEALQGWGVAGGLLARSRSLGQSTDYTTYYAVPGQAEVDANVWYRAERWRVTVGVKNLLSRRLYAADFDETFLPLRTRRSYLLTGTYDF